MRSLPFPIWYKFRRKTLSLTPVVRAVIVLAVCFLLGSPAAVATGTATTTVTLAVTSGGKPVTTVTSGTVVALTATVMAGTSPVTTGQVSFCDALAAHCSGLHLVASAQLTSAGTATFKFRPGAGSHNYKAVFLGTVSFTSNNNAGSSSTSSVLTVSAPAKAATITSIAQSGTVGNYTLTATVSGNGPVAPTGILSFLDTNNGNAIVASTAVSAGPGFSLVTTQNLPDGLKTIASGDFNNDGIPDLVVATQVSDPITFKSLPGYLTVLLGNGDGTFTQTASNPTTGIDPDLIVIGDFNGDGNLDLLVDAVGNGNSTVLEMLGDGQGNFTASSQIATGANSIAVCDFNGDGILDLAINNVNGVTLAQGDGHGNFSDVNTTGGSGATAVAIVTGDFNNDGIPDLAIAYGYSNNVSVLLGKGSGMFTTSANPATGNNPVAIVTGDFNNDGILDLATLNQGATITSNGSVTILLGKGDGTFTATPVSPATGVRSESMVTGDFNGDGISDLMVANTQDNTTTTLLSNGDGTFTSTTTSLAPYVAPLALAVGDWNGDGLADFAAVNVGSYTNNKYFNYGVTAWLSAGQTSTATATGITVNAGSHLVVANYPGDSNYAPGVSGTTNLAGTASTLTLNVNPSGTVASGQPVTLTATLSPYTSLSHSTDGEAVTFYNGSNVLGTGTLSSGVASLTLSLIANTYSVTAEYGGDSYITGSASTAQGFVVAPGLTTILVLSTNTNGSVVSGQPATLTATFSPYTSQGHSTDGETVTFLNQGISIGTAKLANGIATLTFTPMGSYPTGVYRLTASFTPDVYLSGSTSNLVYLSISPAVTTSLTANVSPSNGYYGSMTTMTATLTPSQDQGVSSSGLVTFTNANNGSYLGSGMLSAGVATYAQIDLPVGQYAVQASFAGNAAFAAATSPSTSLTVNPAISTIALTSSANPSTVSNAVRFTATLSNWQGGARTPSQMVFMDGPTQLAVVGINTSGSSQSFTTSTLTSGTHSISVSYSGDANNAPVTSAPLVETINGPTTATMLTLSSSPNVPTVVGQPVTLTATVSPTSIQGVSSDGLPVNFMVGNNGPSLGIALLSSGVATLRTSALPLGQSAIQAYFAANGAFGASSSPAVSLTVNQATPILSLTSSANPALLSNSVTFTATLTGSQATGGQIGTIKFFDGTTQLGSSILNPSGSATFTVSTLAVGTHSITTQFAGDLNDTQATSSPLTETVADFTTGPSGGSGTLLSQTVSPGGVVAYVLAIAPATGTTFPSPVTFSVTGLPSGATATFSPASLPANSGATNVTMTVTLSGASSAARMPTPFGREELPIALGMLLLPFAKRMRGSASRWKSMAALLLLLTCVTCGITCLTACGSVPMATQKVGPPPQSQTYTLTIVATAGALSHSTSATLIVN